MTLMRDFKEICLLQGQQLDWRQSAIELSQANPRTQASPTLAALDPEWLRADDFMALMAARKDALLQLIAGVMGKPVMVGGDTTAEDDDSDDEEE